MKADKLKQNGAALRRLMPYLGRHWLLLALSILLSAASVILQLYVPILFGEAIDRIVAAGRVDFAEMGRYLVRILILASASGILRG